jgi:pilus assembly protein CpaB
MKTRSLLPALVVALLVSGLCTFWLGRRFLSPVRASQGLHYVATTQAMQAGDVLRPTNLKLIEWPANQPLTGAFLKPEQADGRTLLYPLAAGQPVLDQQLSAAGAGPGLSPKIPDGMRAISLKTDEIVGVAGFLLPGTHVDVLVTYHVAPSPDPITSTVLQDAQVLTAGQKMQPDPDGKPNTVDVVTLLVSPEDAEKVTLASAQGTVHFVLRNGADHDHPDQKPVFLSEFGGAPAKHEVSSEPRKAAAPPSPRGYSIQVVRGDKSSTETF